MADNDFEHDLMAMFAEPPSIGGADAFVRGVESRLEQGWTMRRWMVGGLGAVGGIIAASQWAFASLRLRGDSALANDWRAVSTQVSDLITAPATAIGAPAETLYVSIALAVVALVLGVGRLVREI
jgi:hypothetical protein